MEVDTRPQPAGFERRRADLSGRARIRRRLEDHELAGTERRGDRGQCGPHIGQIRCLVAIRGRRHADEHDIGPVEHRPVCRCGEPPGRDQRRETRVCDVLDVAPARVQRIGAFGVGVEADDGEPGLRVRDCQRQPDVAQPDDADDERSARDARIELRVIHRGHPFGGAPPLQRAPQAVFERHLWLPPELGAGSGDVGPSARRVLEPRAEDRFVAHVLDRRGRPREVDDRPSEVVERGLDVRADVEHSTERVGRPRREQRAPHRVSDIGEAPSLAAIAVHGQRLPCERLAEEPRHH